MTLYREFKKTLKRCTYEQICDAIEQYEQLIRQTCNEMIRYYCKCLNYCYKEKHKRDKRSVRKLGR